jgi:hypothetical protein
LLLYDKGDLAAAEPLLHEALEGRREALGDRQPLLQKKRDLAADEQLLHEMDRYTKVNIGKELR